MTQDVPLLPIYRVFTLENGFAVQLYQTGIQTRTIKLFKHKPQAEKFKNQLNDAFWNGVGLGRAGSQLPKVV